MEYKVTPRQKTDFLFADIFPIKIPSAESGIIQEDYDKYLTDLFYNFLILPNEQQPPILDKINLAIDKYNEKIYNYFDPNHFSKLVLLLKDPNFFDFAIITFTRFLHLIPDITKNLLEEDFFEVIEQYIKMPGERCQKSLRVIIEIFKSSAPQDNIQIRNAFYSSNCYRILLLIIEEEQYIDETSEIIYLMTVSPSYPNHFPEKIINILINFIRSLHIIQEINGIKGLNKLLTNGYDISSYVLLEDISETSLLEDFTSFLTIPNEALQIATIEILVNLCFYKDKALKGMVNFHTITEVRELINCSRSTLIVGNSLDFFLKWVLNTTEYYFLLLDEISNINFTLICRQQPVSVKLLMTDLLLRMSQNAKAYQLQRIVTEEFVLTLFEQLDLLGEEFANIFFDLIMKTSAMCQENIELLRMLQNAFHNEEFSEEFQRQVDEVMVHIDSLLENYIE